MTRYVALLRGINVGGRNIIAMPALKACCEAEGLEDVATYIQSGNVIFMTRSTRSGSSYLGRFYDAVTRGSPDMNRHARKKVLGRILPRIRSDCDLGCGTGTTAVELARGGRRVHAVDASPTQCRQARARAREARLPVRVLCADLRSFRPTLLPWAWME